MALKIYVDRMSQPSRAILLLCKVNGIEFEEVKIQLAKSEHKSSEFAEINPMKQVPAIAHGNFRLFESHAILIYLASAFPEVADHWYPADVQKRAKVHSVLDWHHSNLRRGSGYLSLRLELFLDIMLGLIHAADIVLPGGEKFATVLTRTYWGTVTVLSYNTLFSAGYALNSTIILAFGHPTNPKLAAEAEKILSASLSTIESFWLQGDAPFLLGNSQPSIADLALACEVMQIEVVEEEDRDRILGPHKRILKWIEDLKNATEPYFDELHSIMSPVREKLKELKVQAANKL